MQQKEININDNRILRHTLIEDNYLGTYVISEGFLNNKKFLKSYTLSMSDDYLFSAFTDEDIYTIDKISFEFNDNHPLYIPLLHLLNNDDELIIDDDATRELNKNYIRVHKDDNTIYFDFISEIDEDDMNRFNIHIKNIVKDLRSKIDNFNLDTKDRLNTFFKEAYNVFYNPYHQTTIEDKGESLTHKKH